MVKKQKKINGLDQFHWHEALDRAHVIGELLNTSVVDHPVITTNKKLREAAEKAETAVYDLYCAIALSDPFWK